MAPVSRGSVYAPSRELVSQRDERVPARCLYVSFLFLRPYVLFDVRTRGIVRCPDSRRRASSTCHVGASSELAEQIPSARDTASDTDTRFVGRTS